MLAAYWMEFEIKLNEIVWVILFISRNSKLYDLILDNSILAIRNGCLEYRHLGTVDWPNEFLLDLLAKSHKLPENFSGYDKCFQAVCHHHCHEGPDIISEEDCIKNTEAGCNLYYEVEDREQLGWDGE